jgi:NADH-quinone oxidoreductase subunit C
MSPSELAERFRERFDEVLEARGEVTVVAGPDRLLEDLRWLRDDPELSFGFLSDLTATDWPGLDPRMWLAYQLRSIERGHRVRVKLGLPPSDLRAPSVTGLYPTANWHEREVFDFFGVVFDGHPDLRRIEMPEGWVGHPLRKDHPLAGVSTAYRGAFIPPPDERGT